MDKGYSNTDSVSIDCDWCGVSFTTPPIKPLGRSRYYCSKDCGGAADFPMIAILSVPMLILGIPNLLFYYPESFGRDLLFFLMGLGFFYWSFQLWRIRRKTPKGSRKEPQLDNDVG